ncbi:type II toxin-antitoxin system VapB family antitoxin [Caulobacter sp. CCG-8]|uniref:type II toxin-antitoxin system VapB family antitoxin n=1 Tax=Caulobacter sp. CCG-8 TaxID=3127958 RepID=UPI00307DB3EF
MALSIKTREADQLARDLAKLTGETMTRAVTVALQERLDREKAARAETSEAFVARIMAFTAKMRKGGDFRPVTPEEWLDAGGDDLDHELAAKDKAAKAKR